MHNKQEPSKLENDKCRCLFPGFSWTGKNAIYYDADTKVAKITADIAYNKAEMGLISHLPNAHALQDVGVTPDAAEQPIKMDQDFWLDIQ